ncbi:glycerophosphodiester phosphodiesterase [Prosthecobacter sp.]|uniref:glycerophosphodiester phosphodiesterase n=1 Tax=Prosthecobacter sp. TaxID=1965333 RepID=UPI00378308A1
MKIIAHRGGMARSMQNTPAGVRLAVQHHMDFVELDVVRNADGGFHCAHHAWSPKSALHDCLAELSAAIGLVAHLKGDYADDDLARVSAAVAQHVPLAKVVFASHRTGVLRRLRKLLPQVRLARFGLFPALVALWQRQPWDCCMINQVALPRWLVRALQQRGYEVIASCVWELRSRESVRDLGVDGAFVNLSRGKTERRRGGCGS